MPRSNYAAKEEDATRPAGGEPLRQCILQWYFLQRVAQTCIGYCRLLLPPMAADRHAHPSILHHTPFALCLPAAAQAGKRLLCAGFAGVSRAAYMGKPGTLRRDAGDRQH